MLQSDNGRIIPMTTAMISSRLHFSVAFAFLVCLVLSARPAALMAQEAGHESDEINPLVVKQKMIRDRFERFQDRIYRLREQLAETEPENAARLQRALERAGELGLADQLDEVMDLLSSTSTLNTALDAQAEWVEKADRLLSILLERDSGNDLRRNELERLGTYKEQVDRILAEERALRQAAEQAALSNRIRAQLDGALQRLDAIQQQQDALSDQASRATENRQPDELNTAGAKEENLSQQTKQLGEDVERLSKLDQSEGSDDKAVREAQQVAAEASQSLQAAAQAMQQAAQQLQSGQGEAGQQAQQNAQKALEEAREQLEAAKNKLEEEAQTQEQAEQQKKLAEETKELADQMRQDAAPSPGGQPTPGGQSTPGMENLDQAQRNMDDAGKSLQQKEPEKAVPQQQRAIEELEQAQQELEKALNQLRQEERAETLRDLEHRFREMLVKQQAINEGTLSLDRVGVDHFTRVERLQLAELTDEERMLARTASRCLHILEEDATTVVFPRIIGQLAEDMDVVADRLADQKVEAITQKIQKEIVETLEQLVEAVQQMQRENEQQAGRGMPSSDDENQPLLPTSAELKLLKASQVRINDRTSVISDAVQSGSESPPGAQKEFQIVAERQRETAEVARELRDRGSGPR
jgi:hypothetical protein